MTRAFEVTDRGFALEAVAVGMGDDLLIAVTGGEKPHIGSASVSVPRPSLSNPSMTSSTTSTINLTGHKDNIVGDRISAFLSAALKTNVVVACGIHIDNLRPEEIGHIVTLSEKLAEKIVEGMKQR
jgi:hypothetical protein